MTWLESTRPPARRRFTQAYLLKRAERYKPVKGAGGRFIRREDEGKPFPKGLKAVDPKGRARALAACDAIDPVAHAAQRDAERNARRDAVVRALNACNRAAGKLTAYREARNRDRACKKQLRLTGPDSSFYRRLPKPPKNFVESPDIENALALTLKATIDWLKPRRGRSEKRR